LEPELKLERSPSEDPFIAAHTAQHCITFDELRVCGSATQETLRRGDYLFRSGELSHYLYFIAEGLIEKSLTTHEGRRVYGYRVAGDMLGLDALGDTIHKLDARALCSTVVWRISRHALQVACAKTPSLRERLTLAKAAETRRLRCWECAAGALDDEQRVAVFLRDMRLRSPDKPFDKKVLRRNRFEIARWLNVDPGRLCRQLAAP